MRSCIDQKRISESQFSAALLKHPYLAPVLITHQRAVDHAHDLFLRWGAGYDGVTPTQLLTCFDDLQRFITDITQTRQLHAYSPPLLKPLAYTHFLTGLMALAWIDTSKIICSWSVEYRERAPKMLQAALTHLTTAIDLEASMEAISPARGDLPRVVLSMALAEAYAWALRHKAYLASDAAPFMFENLSQHIKTYRRQARAELAHLNVSDKDLLAACLQGLYSLAPAHLNQLPDLEHGVDTRDLVKQAKIRDLRRSGTLRLLYGWKHLHATYRQGEKEDYERARAPKFKGPSLEILPMPSSDKDVVMMALCQEQSAFQHRPQDQLLLFDTLNYSILDRRLTLADIFDAPSLGLTVLFRRALYQMRSMHHKTDARLCRLTCEAALKALKMAKISQEDHRFFLVNLTAILARAVLSESQGQSVPKIPAQKILESINPEIVRGLPLKDRWLYHETAWLFHGGPNRSLTTRGKKYARAAAPIQKYTAGADARRLLRLLAQGPSYYLKGGR